MDYEKAYKGAIERAKAEQETFIKGGNISGKSAIERIFPELYVSENERIKNEIIAFVEQSIHRGGGTPIPQEQENKWIAWLEKQGEQKPTDKVEPKFKVGDWITNGGLLVGQVTSFDGEYYHYMCEGIEQPLHISNAYNWHLWTIQDAKDGDVLSDEKPFIFRGFGDSEHPNNPTAYCGITSSGTFILSTENEWWTADDFYPATKEQRELLFQKMKEAGYEWNAEKKELNKIEQESTWNEKIKGLNELETYILSLVPDRSLDAIKVDAKNIRYIINKEQKPSCSDDDESWFKELELMALSFSNDDSYRKKFFDWLKSLKDRVQPQPKQGWNKEDERMIDTIIYDLKRHGGKEDSCYSAEINWLKSFKPNYL